MAMRAPTQMRRRRLYQRHRSACRRFGTSLKTQGATSGGEPMHGFREVNTRNVHRDALRAFSLLALAAAALSAQSLQISSAAAPGENSQTIEISLKSPPEKAPVALQWEVIFPATELALAERDVVIGPAGEKAGKAVACAVKGKTAESARLVCILAGGERPIQNGIVAILKPKMARNAPVGHAPVRLERAIAVFGDVTEVAIKPASTRVAIRGK